MRTRRSLATTLTAATVLGLLGPAPAAAEVPYQPPGPLPAVEPDTLADRYRATGRAVARAREVADAAGDDPRAEALAALRGRDLLDFDARGNGRVVEVVGDLAAADRIAVLVPGSHTSLDTFSYRRGPGGAAQALAAEVTAIDPGTRVAVVAWLGYDTPQGVSHQLLTDRLARAGEPALRAAVATLRRLNPTASISLLCHSYGSVVCAYAVPGLPVADLVLYGSPGVVADHADQLATDARVWAGRSGDDWIRFVPAARLAGVGFGADPVDGGFGARAFDAGAGGHGDYHLAGGPALRNLALIVLGAGAPGRSGLPAVSRG